MEDKLPPVFKSEHLIRVFLYTVKAVNRLCHRGEFGNPVVQLAL